MISGPAKDDCGAASTTPAAAGIVAIFDKKDRRSDSPPLTENAAVDVILKSRAMAVTKDFMVMVLIVFVEIMREQSAKS